MLPLLTHLTLSEHDKIPFNTLAKLLLHPNLHSLSSKYGHSTTNRTILALIELISEPKLFPIIHNLRELDVKFTVEQLITVLDNYRNIQVLTIYGNPAKEMLLYWKNNFSTHRHAITTLHIDLSDSDSKSGTLEVILPPLEELSVEDWGSKVYVVIGEGTNHLKRITFARYV